MKFQRVIVLTLIFISLLGCSSRSGEAIPTTNLEKETSIPSLPTVSATPNATGASPAIAPELTSYAFPISIDPTKQYLFYLHGKIIEDQGIPAISPEFGEYQYEAILEKLRSYDFVVISEQRPKDTHSFDYAKRVQKQVETLIEAGVPAGNITVVGASKGAAIAVLVSHLLENEEVNFVLLGSCHPDTVDEFMKDQVRLVGNVLSIYDSVDKWAGSCQGLFSLSEISNYDEIVLEIGTGHGVLYQPLDAWILPTVRWANNNAE